MGQTIAQRQLKVLAACDAANATQKLTLKQLWAKACEADGIDPNSKFVVFSKDNPWIARYNRAANLVQRAKFNNWSALRGRI